MPKYIVTIKEVYNQPWEVEANSEAEALEKAADGDGEILDDCLEFSYALDSDRWEVELIPENEKERNLKNVLELLG
jgi:hypothetical protein